MADAVAVQPNWHHPLYLGNGDVWRQRIPVSVINASTNRIDGFPVSVPIGPGSNEVQLAGRRSEDVRVLDAAGKEMLFAILDRDGDRVETGPIGDGGTFYLPAECGPATNAQYFIYFDNPSAWRVPDSLDVEPSDINGGFETGDVSMARGWIAKDEDASHRAIWSAEGARSGKHCIRHEVDAGAPPNWLGVTRRIAPVTPGARCRIRAWTRAENVVGQAGWFVHAGDPSGMLLNRVLGAGGASYDWKEIALDITIPPGASWLTIGTSLRGTGTAWFDDLTVECSEPPPLKAVASPPESLSLQETSTSEVWPSGGAKDCRIPASFVNLSDQPIAKALGFVSLPSGRLAGSVKPASIYLGGAAVPFTRLGDMLLFDCALPARSRVMAHVYLDKQDHAAAGDAMSRSGAASDIPSDYRVVRRARAIGGGEYETLLNRPTNLVRNPDFSDGAPLPDAWEGAAGSKGTMTLDGPGLFGERCVRMDLPAGNRSWKGWRQAVPVKGGRTYLVGAWAKSRGIDGEARLYIHLLTPQRRLVASSAFSSAGEPISGDSEWTPWLGTITVPEDCGFLELHLTMNAGGTLWHDGAVVAEIVPGVTGALKQRSKTDGHISIWPVNAIVKVFREDPVPEKSGLAEVFLARNESEPLQLALRSGANVDDVTVEIEQPTADDGSRLPNPEVHRVGFVPIDHPTSYFRSESPPWHRKFPTSPGHCDGWAGFWPDPLLPMAPFRLVAEETQPIWITFRSPPDAAPGEYRGSVKIKSHGKTLAEMPHTVRVWDFELPKKRNLIAIYDVRPGKPWFEKGEKREDVVRAMMRFLSERRLCADHVPAQPVFKREGDRVTADFGAFDSAAQWYFDELSMPVAYFPQFFYLFGWAHPPKKILGEEPYEGGFPYEGKDRSKLRAEYVRIYQAALRLFWDHLKSKGWSDKMVLYISDEPHFSHEHVRAQMRALCEMIHGVDPAIPIYSSTWRHCAEWNNHLDVWGVGHYGCFPVEEMTRRKKEGDRIWFTTDGQMCTDTPFCAVERLLPHYCFHNGADAYEFWGVDWLTYDPHQFGWHSYIGQSDQPGNHYYVRYPNGDGYLTYPGAPVGVNGPISTIRLEQAREGAEDYEYLLLLKVIAAKGGDRAAAAADLLRKAAELVPIPNAGGRYSSRILPDPDAVSALRRAAGHIIEGH